MITYLTVNVTRADVGVRNRPSNNDTYLRCVVPASTGVGKNVYVVVSAQSSVESWLFNYAKPVLYGLLNNFGPPTGQRIWLIGQNFGYDTGTSYISISINGGDSCGSIIHYNDTHVSCMTPAGDYVGANVFITV